MKHITESIIIGVDFSSEDQGVLLVGRKKDDGSVDIINAFESNEAYELYMKLITKKEN
ncbi:hypothetical protein [Fibrobacter sp.]|uniref:hypothetical protein n=1 Tax=Fibrobacter sp. TaxID=35828 RepID=UPI0038900C65